MGTSHFSGVLLFQRSYSAAVANFSQILLNVGCRLLQRLNQL